MSIFNTFADQVRAFSDADLLAAYERTNGEPDNPEAAALLTEIERRGLDVRITAHTPEQVAAMALDPEFVADLDNDTLLLSLDAASDDDRHVFMGEVSRRGLEI